MTQLASDDFTGAAALLSARSGWVKETGTFDNISTDGSGALTMTGLSGDAHYIYTATSAPADQYSQIQVLTAVGAGGGRGVGPIVRAATGAITLYRVVVDNGSGGWFELSKSVSGAFTVLSSGAHAFTPGDTIRLEAQGTTITSKQNGTQIQQVTDSAIASGGWGIAYSSTETSDTMDNWAAGDFSSGDPKAFCSIIASIVRSRVA